MPARPQAAFIAWAAGVNYAFFIGASVLDRRRGIAHSRRLTLLWCLLVPALPTAWLAFWVLGLTALGIAATFVWAAYGSRRILRGSTRPRPDRTRAQLAFLRGVAGYSSLLLVGAVAVGLVSVFPG